MSNIKRFERKRSKESWEEYFARISKDFDECIKTRGSYRHRKGLS